jgi:hypothetical protein
MGYGLDNWGSIPGRGKIFLFSIVSRLALEATQHPIQWVSGALSLGKNWQRHETDHSHLLPRSRMVELYLHSPIHLHGILLA